MSAELVLLRTEGPVAFLTLNNPPLNVLTPELRPQWFAAVERIEADPSLRVVVLTGAGERSFCSGADLGEESELTPETVRRFLNEDRKIYDAMERVPVPVIAAVNGYCMGGGLELALACDIRIAADEARFRAAGARVGLISSSARLTKLLGPARAKDLLLTARDFDGREAERLGLASRSVPRESLMAEATAWAAMIAERAPLAVRKAKYAVDEAADLDFPSALDRELDYFAALSVTRDHKHAVEAFFKKERPIFTGE